MVKMISMLFQMIYYYYNNDDICFIFKEKNQQYLSDLITFTVPESTDQTDTVNLTVREEPVPGTLLGLFFDEYF